MKLTNHAIARKQQRGFSDAILKIIEENGSYLNAPGGAVKIYFGRKEHRKAVEHFKKCIQLADKAKGGTIIVEDEIVLTVYKNS
jgi:hypothetical protein